MKCEAISFFTDPSFLGALLGAIITGVIAMIVFWLGNKSSDEKKERIISNYIDVIQKVHDITNQNFKEIQNLVKEKDTFLSNHQTLISQLIIRGKMLELIDLNELILVSEKTFYAMEYITNYQEAVKNIAMLKNKYGILQYAYINNENDRTNIEWLDFYINNMEAALEKMNK